MTEYTDLRTLASRMTKAELEQSYVKAVRNNIKLKLDARDLIVELSGRIEDLEYELRNIKG